MGNQAALFDACVFSAKWFHISREEGKPGRKTADYRIVNNDGQHIGDIRFYGPFRQYSFFPMPDTVMSYSCLSDINRFISKLEDLRRQELYM